MWTFKMDRDTHLTIKNNGRVVFEGSYEAFCADGDVVPPSGLVHQIEDRYELLTSPKMIRCADCGRSGHTRGHMECPEPR